MRALRRDAVIRRLLKPALSDKAEPPRSSVRSHRALTSSIDNWGKFWQTQRPTADDYGFVKIRGRTEEKERCLVAAKDRDRRLLRDRSEFFVVSARSRIALKENII